jgi:hypothetical protein
VPTVAFNLRKVRKGNVTLKIWDVAGALEAVTSPGRVLTSFDPQGNQNFGQCGRGIAVEWTR